MAGKFSWSNLGADFIHSIVFSEKNKVDKPREDTKDLDQLIPYIELVADRPDPAFTKRFRTEIEDNFIFRHEDCVDKICKKMPGYKSLKNKSTMIDCLRNRRTTAELIALYDTCLLKYGKVKGSHDNIYSIFHSPVNVDLANMEASDVSLHDYQADAVANLNQSFIKSNIKSGFLVMPTGSGKTRTAVYFLLRHLVNDGYQVIWLTHRALLVDQTAQTFHDMSPLTNLDGNKKESLRIICVSDEHCKVREVEKADDVVILMVPSISKNTDYLKSILKDKVIVVIDEAHHTYAKTYRKTLDCIRELRPKAMLLGLTATPIRTNDDETKYLRSIFENRIIYQISISKLISNGVLATPQCMSIQTDYSVVTTKDDRKYINKWGEVSPRLIEIIAKSTKRNKKIVDTYLQNVKEGDKTLIFAMNQIHAVMLYEDMKKKGVKAAVVHSGLAQNEDKILAFKNGDIDVLININILTEGSDIPGVNAVFLTRPTKSDVLLMQMIGRGMRGVRVGGKEKVTIVDFVDKWDNFIEWLNPKFEMEIEYLDKLIDPLKSAPAKTYQIDWALIREIYDSLYFPSLDSEIPYITLPYGWYQLLLEGEYDTSILVFEDQYEGYRRLIEDLKAGKVEKSTKPLLLISQYWRNFEKNPSLNDIKLLLDYVKKHHDIPEFFLFGEREQIDPALMAINMRLKNVGLQDIDALIESTYSEHKSIIDCVFQDFDSYRRLVFDYIKYKSGVMPVGAPIKLIDKVLIPFSFEPYHDIQRLALKAFDFFKSTFKKVPKTVPNVSWTEDQPMRYYGYYQGGNIKINSILNSKDVPEETIIYLIYHELLHYKQDLLVYPDHQNNLRHDTEFRKWEHEFPDYTKHEQFLDGKFRQFDTKFSW